MDSRAIARGGEKKDGLPTQTYDIPDCGRLAIDLFQCSPAQWVVSARAEEISIATNSDKTAGTLT